MQQENEGKANLSRRLFLTALAGLPFVSLSTTSVWAAAPTPFSFIYITDTHLVNGQPDNGYKMLQESQLFLQEIVKGVNALKPDFVIFGGDQVETVGNNETNWQFFLDIMQSLHCPWYFVLGEQDVSGKLPVDKMKQFGPDFKGRGIKVDTPYWSADPMPNVHLIGLDTSKANANMGELSEQQLEWLKLDLEANRGKFTMLVTHHPLLPPPPYDGGPPWDEYILENGADVREILGKFSDVRLVMSGHLYMNKAQVERDVFHVSCAGLDVFPCQYKYFRVTKDSIVMESFDVPLPKLVKKAEDALVNSSLASKMSRRKPEAIVDMFRGADEDQNALFTITGAKTIKPLSKKQIKEDQEKRDLELEKQAEEARNKGKGKGKSKKGDDKKGDDKKADDKKANDKKANDKKSDNKEDSGKKSQPESGKEKTETGSKEKSESTGKEKSSRSSSKRGSKSKSSPSESKDKGSGESSGTVKDAPASDTPVTPEAKPADDTAPAPQKPDGESGEKPETK